MEKITILIAEAQLLFRQNLCTVLDYDPRFKVVGETDCGEQAIELSKKLCPHIVLMDCQLPGIDTISFSKYIRTAPAKTKFIGLSATKDPNCAMKMLHIGAMGFITKYISIYEFLQAIIDVANGMKYISRDVTLQVSTDSVYENGRVRKIDMLTNKEMEIITLIKSGFTSKEMAEKLCVSVNTIIVHRYNILKKLDLKNTASLVNYIYNN